MSALADDSGHFVRFCQHIDPAFNSATFASRRLYGDYLELTLRQETERNRGTSLEKVHGEAIAVRQQPGDNAYQIDLANGRIIRAHQVVLALGHFPPLNPAPIAGLNKTSAYIGNPWDSAALERSYGEAPVALLGMGLTALDVLFRLTSSSDTRKIYLVSRHGLFHSPIVSTQNRRPQQVFHLFSRICRPPCGPILAPCVRKSGKMLPAAATGATLSTFSAPIRRKYGGSSRWKSGKDFFLALSLTGIFIVIGSPHPLICA